MAAGSTAAMVVIGNEILSGKVRDSNSPFLARELRTLGVQLQRITVIPDDVETIATTVAEHAAVFDAVFTSGGVGPTHDDITIEGIARAFGVEVVEHPDLRRLIESYAKGPPSPSFLKMAEVPQGATLDDVSGATFPVVVMRNVYILPGIPEIFEAKVASLRDRFRQAPFHLRQVLVSLPETSLADYLNATLEAFPDVLLGSYPKLKNPEYKVRVTLESKDEDYLERALADLLARVPEDSVVKVDR